ncbi:MAG: hypothetical protein K5894_15010, partial [Lachnospiraceae bacterium]|nr:hypothetical protein [Lachnospiraceae bacterium]
TIELRDYGKNRPPLTEAEKNLQKLIEKNTTDSNNARKQFDTDYKKYRDELKTNGWTYEQLMEQMLLIRNLDRVKIMTFKNEEEFLKNYSDNALKIKQAIDAFEYMKKLRKDNDPMFKRVMEDLKKNNISLKWGGLGEKDFDEITTGGDEGLRFEVEYLKVIDMYMDSSIKNFQNPANTFLSSKIEALNSLSPEELEVEIKNKREFLKNVHSKEVKDNLENELDYLKNLATIKNVKKYDVFRRNKEKIRREANLVNKPIWESKDKKSKFNFKFFNLHCTTPGNSNKIKIRQDEGMYPRGDKYKGKVGIIDASTKLFEGKLHVFKLQYKSEDIDKYGNYISSQGHLSVGNVRTTAKAGFSWSSGEKADDVKAEIGFEAEASVARGVIKHSMGVKDKYEVDVKGEVTALAVKAGAYAGIGAINYVGTDGNNKKTLGAAARFDALATVASGKISGGFSIFGVRIGGSLEGSIATGAQVGFAFGFDKGFSFSLGAALGLGGGISITVDWSKAFLKLRKAFREWRLGCRNKLIEAAKEAEEKKDGKEAEDKKDENIVHDKKDAEEIDDKKKFIDELSSKLGGSKLEKAEDKKKESTVKLNEDKKKESTVKLNENKKDDIKKDDIKKDDVKNTEVIIVNKNLPPEGKVVKDSNGEQIHKPEKIEAINEVLQVLGALKPIGSVKFVSGSMRNNVESNQMSSQKEINNNINGQNIKKGSVKDQKSKNDSQKGKEKDKDKGKEKDKNKSKVERRNSKIHKKNIKGLGEPMMFK